MVKTKKTGKPKATSPTKEEVLTKASRQLIRQHNRATQFNRGGKKTTDDVEHLPQYSLKNVLTVVRNDSTAWSGITTLVDRTLQPGWYIRKVSGGRDKEFDARLRNKKFDLLIRDFFFSLFTFQNAFFEMVYTNAGDEKNKTVKELHLLDPTTIKIETDKHGEVLKYVQETEGHPGVEWSPDEIVHVKMSQLDTNAWGEIDIRTIYQAAKIKADMKRYVEWLFATNQFRGLHNVKSGSDDAINDYLSYLRDMQTDYNKELVIEGEIEHKVLRTFNDGDMILKWLYKMDEDILNLLQVPPIFAGLPDNSNRSNSDAQERAFNTHIKSIQDIVAKQLTFELLPKMRMFGAEFAWYPLTNKLEKDVIEAAKVMREIGMKTDIIIEYLRKNGLDVGDQDVFEEPEVEASPEDDRDTGDTTQMSNQIGTGEESTTREEQLTKAASRWDWQKDTFKGGFSSDTGN